MFYKYFPFTSGLSLNITQSYPKCLF